jgi:hypothetical protein
MGQMYGTEIATLRTTSGLDEVLGLSNSGRAGETSLHALGTAGSSRSSLASPSNKVRTSLSCVRERQVMRLEGFEPLTRGLGVLYRALPGIALPCKTRFI